MGESPPPLSSRGGIPPTYVDRSTFPRVESYAREERGCPYVHRRPGRTDRPQAKQRHLESNSAIRYKQEEASGVEGTPVPRGRKGEAKVPTKYQKMSFRRRLKLGILVLSWDLRLKMHL